MPRRNYLFLSKFTMRLIAIIAVLSDHIAFAFVMPNTALYSVMRIFGRVAFVLFAFFVVEGAVYSKNKDRYLLRLLYLYIIMQVLIVSVNLYDASFIFQNIFLTLGAGASLLVYFEKKEWRKVYYIIPFLLAVTVNVLALNVGIFGLLIYAGDYGNYGLLLIVGFYVTYIFTKKLLAKYNINPTDDATPAFVEPQMILNSAVSIFLLIYTFIYYVLDIYSLTTFDVGMQSFAIITIPLFMFYSGKLGYTSKAWQTIYYVFFPLHIIIIAIISQLL